MTLSRESNFLRHLAGWLLWQISQPIDLPGRTQPAAIRYYGSGR